MKKIVQKSGNKMLQPPQGGSTTLAGSTITLLGNVGNRVQGGVPRCAAICAARFAVLQFVAGAARVALASGPFLSRLLQALHLPLVQSWQMAFPVVPVQQA
eukprot:992036-Amphidinium_carterae.1